jgi:hypothetical protein
MSPGRNDPCSCGSGKKYKHCCLVSEQQRSESPDEIVWRRVRRIIGDAPRLLSSFIADVYEPEAVEQAWDEFTVWEGYPFDEESPMMAIFMPWLFHCWEPDPHEEPAVVPAPLQNRPPTSVFLERRGARLEPLLKRYLEACLEAAFSFHEILRADPGRGFRTRDLLTGAEHDVREATASRSMQAGDVLFAMLVPIDGIVILEACSPYVLSPQDKIPIIELREQFEAKPVSAARFKDDLRGYDIEIREVYIHLMRRVLDPHPPILHNTDGELLELNRLVYDVDDAERAFTALGRTFTEGEVARAPDGRLERAARVRELLDQALDGVARLRSAEVLDPAELDTELEPAGGDGDMTAEELAALPEVREHLSRMYEKHYEDWVTHPLPALGGRRPIDVVSEPNGREKVEALIADFERHAARAGDGLSDAALGRLRERLGLARS